jgi:hypothetical protein
MNIGADADISVSFGMSFGICFKMDIITVNVTIKINIQLDEGLYQFHHRLMHLQLVSHLGITNANGNFVHILDVKASVKASVVKTNPMLSLLILKLNAHAGSATNIITTIRMLGLGM